MVDLTGATWRKSTRSNQAGNCIEVADLANVVGVRDSKDPTGPKLAINPASWVTFTHHVKTNEHDVH